jgi:hypothetical protein
MMLWPDQPKVLASSFHDPTDRHACGPLSSAAAVAGRAPAGGAAQRRDAAKEERVQRWTNMDLALRGRASAVDHERASLASLPADASRSRLSLLDRIGGSLSGSRLPTLRLSSSGRGGSRADLHESPTAFLEAAAAAAGRRDVRLSQRRGAIACVQVDVERDVSRGLGVQRQSVGGLTGSHAGRRGSVARAPACGGP